MVLIAVLPNPRMQPTSASERSSVPATRRWRAAERRLVHERASRLQLMRRSLGRRLPRRSESIASFQLRSRCSPEDAIHFQPPRTAMTDDSYDYDANCRRWPDVAGPFPVGTVDFEVTDPIRSSQYAPEPTVTRRLYVRAWYPAGDVTGDSRQPVFHGGRGRHRPGQVLRAASATARRVAQRCRAHDQCLCRGATGGRAVSRCGVQSRILVVSGATHRVVRAPRRQRIRRAQCGPPLGERRNRLPNGDAVVGSPRIFEDMMQIGQALGAMAAYAAPTLTAQLEAFREYVKILRTTSAGRLAPVWRDDVYFVLDRLEENTIPAASSVAAMIDHERRGYMGKSFGAYIAGMLAQGDPRSRGVVHLDGGLWSYELADTELRTPFLTLGSDVWEDFRKMPELPRGMDPSVREPLGPQTPAAADLAYERLARAGLRSDGYRFVIPGIRHQWRFRSARTGRSSGAAWQAGDGGCAHHIHRDPERPREWVPRPSRERRAIGLPSTRTRHASRADCPGLELASRTRARTERQ